jgi:hypothetical protein
VWDPYTSQVLRAGQGRILTTGDGVTNGFTFQVAAPRALKDKKKSDAIEDYLERLRRATAWVYDHQEEWAEVWWKDTGLPYEVALASVRRTNASRVAVAVDDPLIASEQEIADAFRAQRVGGAAADAGPARRFPRRPGVVPEPVGGRRPGAGRSGHRAGRQSQRGRESRRGVPRAGRRALRAVRFSHLEEAYWFGEGVTPELAARGLLADAGPAAGAASAGAASAPLLVTGGR